MKTEKNSLGKLVLFGAAFALLAAPLRALEEERSRVSIVLEGGLAFPLSPSDFSGVYKRGTDFGGRVRYDLSEKWAVAGAFASQTFKQKDNLTQRLITQPVTFMAFYSPTRTYLWNPYGAIGLGVSRHERRTFAVDHEWTKLTGLLGLGLEFNLTRINTISVETLYRYYGKASTSEKDFQSASVSLLFAFYLPYSWIPDKPKKPLLPLYVQDTAEEEKQDAEKQQAQDELNKVQQDILDKRIPSILFEVGKAVILPESYETLDIVGTILKRYPQFSVRVEGHTDDVGSELDNMILSQSRAEAVRKYLIDNFRVTEQKITALGFGETQPIADNESEEGRAKNRRVEFKIIQ